MSSSCATPWGTTGPGRSRPARRAARTWCSRSNADGACLTAAEPAGARAGDHLHSYALKCTMCACLCSGFFRHAERCAAARAPRRHHAHPARRPGRQAGRPGAPAEESRPRRQPVLRQPRPARPGRLQGARPLPAAAGRGDALQRRLRHAGAVRARAAPRRTLDRGAAHHHRRRAKRRGRDRQGRMAGSRRHHLRRRHHIHSHRQRARPARARQPPAHAVPGLTSMSSTLARAGVTPIVLAYSGGLDTSLLVPWITATQQRPVITVTVDTGGIDATAARQLGERARALGAVAHHQVDARADYFEQVLRFLIMGNVRRGQLYPLCVGAERVMQAQTIARMAQQLKSDTIAHGCTAAGNDQVRFEVALRTLAPDLKVLAPVRDQAFKRQDELDYLRQRGLPLPPSGAAYSVNRGLWGVTIGGQETLTSSGSIPEDAWLLTRGAFTQARAAERHVLGFRHGLPVTLDGKPLPPVAIIEALEALAAPFGIGRGIHLGDTII